MCIKHNFAKQEKTADYEKSQQVIFNYKDRTEKTCTRSERKENTKTKIKTQTIDAKKHKYRAEWKTAGPTCCFGHELCLYRTFVTHNDSAVGNAHKRTGCVCYDDEDGQLDVGELFVH